MYQLFPIDTFMVSYYIYGRHTCVSLCLKHADTGPIRAKTWLGDKAQEPLSPSNESNRDPLSGGFHSHQLVWRVNITPHPFSVNLVREKPAWQMDEERWKYYVTGSDPLGTVIRTLLYTGSNDGLWFIGPWTTYKNTFSSCRAFVGNTKVTFILLSTLTSVASDLFNYSLRLYNELSAMPPRALRDYAEAAGPQLNGPLFQWVFHYSFWITTNWIKHVLEGNLRAVTSAH